MTTNTVNVVNATGPSVDSPTMTVTYYQQVAAELMAKLDEVAQIIPKLEDGQVFTADVLRVRLGLPTAFLSTVTSAVEQLLELQATQQLDVLAARDTLQFLEAFRPALDKAEAFTKNLKHTWDSRKAQLGGEALVTYDLAQGFARNPKSKTMASHVANMKRDLGRRGRPKKAAALRKKATPDNVVALPRLLSGSANS